MTAATPAYQAPPNGWRTFLIVWATQSISVFGSALTGFAITVWLTVTLYPNPEQKPELAWALSALNLSFAIPVVFGAPIAGAFADRHDRKRIMMVSDFLNGVVSVATMYLIATRQLTIPWLILVGVCSATITAFHNAAFDTSYAMLVPEERLPRANGMMQTIFALSGILSPSVSATLIALPALVRENNWAWLKAIGQIKDGALLAIGVDAVTFFIAAATLIFLFIPSPTRTDLTSATGAKKSLWADVREGALYIWHRRSFLWLLGTFAVANFTGGAQVLMPLILKFQLAPDWSARGLSLEGALAMINTAFGIGGLTGGILVSSWGGLKSRRVFGVLVPLIVSGLMLMVFGLSRWIILSTVLLGGFALLTPFMNVHSQTIWQSQVPREMQGRVFAVRRLIAQFTWPVSAFLMGGLASRFDPGAIVVAVGAVLVVWCVIGLFNPYLRRIEDKAWIEAQAAKYIAKATEPVSL